jgi:hypothetical protein
MSDNFTDYNGVLLQGHIKIHDPQTEEIIVDGRA